MSTETVEVNVSDLQALFGGTDGLHRCLFEFAEKGNLAGIRLALAAQADVNAINIYGETSTHIVAKHGYAQALALLRNAGADLDAKIYAGITPAHLAAQYGQIKILALLDECGANLNHTDYKGDTPADWAMTRGHTEAADLIKKALLRRAEEEKRDVTTAFAGGAVMPKGAKQAPISRRDALVI